MFELISFKKALKQVDKQNLPVSQKLRKKREIIGKVEELSLLLKSKVLFNFFDKKSKEFNEEELIFNKAEINEYQ